VGGAGQGQGLALSVSSLVDLTVELESWTEGEGLEIVIAEGQTCSLKEAEGGSLKVGAEMNLVVGHKKAEVVRLGGILMVGHRTYLDGENV
jgi:hypothetical protein